MFGFAKQVFVVAMTCFSYNVLNVNSLEYVSMNNQECKTRTRIININQNEPVFCCNNVNDPYAKLYVPDVVKTINVEVFNFMSFSNQTRHIDSHETCKCKCRLDASVCNNKQKWNEDKCRRECREELSDKKKV